LVVFGLSLLGLFLDIRNQNISLVGGVLQSAFLLFEGDFHLSDGDGSFGNLFQTDLEITFLDVQFGVILLHVEGLVGVQVREIGLGSHEDLSSHLLVIEFADLGHQLMHGTHVLVKLDLGFGLGVEFLEVLDEGLGHGNKSLLRPGQEPVDTALVEEGRELSGSLSELLADGGEAQHDVQVVSHLVDEVVPQLNGGRLGNAFFLAELLGDVSEPGFLLVLGDQSGDFSRRQQHVDVLEELLLLDFSVGHDESHGLALVTSQLQVLLDFFLQVLLAERLGQHQLSGLVSADFSRQSGKRLLTGSSHTDQKGTGTGLLNDTGNTDQMAHGIVEQNEPHLLGRVFHVVIVQ